MGNCFAGITGGPPDPLASNYSTLPRAPEPVPEVEPPSVAEEPPEEEAAPPAPQKPARTCPIMLEHIQGEWVNSIGAKIKVDGVTLSLNGMPMPMQKVNLREDGTVASVGSIWQMKGWLPDDCLEFKEAPSVEVMEFARSVTWTPVTKDTMAAWQTHMNNLGYAGSSSDVLSRGIEGCAPGTCDAKARIIGDDPERDRKELELLNRLLAEYREPGMAKVPSRNVIPDFSNRGHTGLSVEHVHYLAKSFKEKGFIKRGSRDKSKDHDIPVLVRESNSSDLGQKAIANWRQKIEDEPGFPPKEHYERLFNKTDIYCSLGNGHFNQALNLYFNECQNIYGDDMYRIGNDDALKEAVYEGIESLVLRADMPLRDRETVSRLLNSKREFKWDINPDGSLNINDAFEDKTQCKQFEAMSKVLDAQELNCLVRAELGITESHRIGQ